MVEISKKTVLICFIFLSLHSFGQTDYRPGYYITFDNDTVSGLINYRGETWNSKFCSFKETDNANEQRFYPTDIQSYRFTDGKYYISKTIETKDSTQEVFLEFLLNGYKNLYFYGDIDNFAYYLEEQDGRLISLKKATIFYEQGEKKVAQQDYRYIGALKATLYDCPDIQNDIDRVTLTHDSLIKLLRKYNDCVCDDNCVVYEKDLLPKVKFQVAPTVGFGKAHFYTDKAYDPVYDFDRNNYVSYGLQINTVFPRISKSLSLQVGLQYFKNEFNLLLVTEKTSLISKSDIHVNTTSLQPSFALKYTYPKGKIKPSVAVGFMLNYFLDNETYYVQNKTYGSTTFTSDMSGFLVGTNKAGAMVQLGCNYRIFKNREIFTNFSYTRCSGSEPYVYEEPANNLFDSEVRKFLEQMQFTIGMYINKM